MERLNKEQRKLVEDNMPLTTYTILKLHYRVTDETISDAYYGLCRAAAMFDPSKGYKFNTYAVRCIRSQLALGIRHKNAKCRIPEDQIMSLDYTYTDDDSRGVRTLEMILYDDCSNNLEERVVFKDVIDNLNRYLDNKQSDRNKQIFLGHINGYKQWQLAKQYNLAQATISRIIRKIQKEFKAEYYGKTNY